MTKLDKAIQEIIRQQDRAIERRDMPHRSENSLGYFVTSRAAHHVEILESVLGVLNTINETHKDSTIEYGLTETEIEKSINEIADWIESKAIAEGTRQCLSVLSVAMGANYAIGAIKAHLTYLAHNREFANFKPDQKGGE